MNRGRERINPEFVQAIAEVGLKRAEIPTDKELMALYRVSRSSIIRIMRDARRSIAQQMSQNITTKSDDARPSSEDA